MVAMVNMVSCTICPLQINKANMGKHMQMSHREHLIKRNKQIQAKVAAKTKEDVDWDEEGDDFFEDKPQLKSKAPRAPRAIAPNVSGVTIAPKLAGLSIMKTGVQRNGLQVTQVARPLSNLNKSLPAKPLQKPLLPKTAQPVEATVTCGICKKVLFSKYLKVHMETSHSGAVLPATQAQLGSGNSKCTVCAKEMPGKYLQLHMSQYHRDAMLQQVRARTGGIPLAKQNNQFLKMLFFYAGEAASPPAPPAG